MYQAHRLRVQGEIKFFPLKLDSYIVIMTI